MERRNMKIIAFQLKDVNQATALVRCQNPQLLNQLWSINTPKEYQYYILINLLDYGLGWLIRIPAVLKT